MVGPGSPRLEGTQTIPSPGPAVVVPEHGSRRRCLWGRKLGCSIGRRYDSPQKQIACW